MAELSITRLAPDDASRLRQWLAVMREGYTAGRTGAWWASEPAMLTQFAHPRHDKTDIALLAHLGGEPIGGAEINLLTDSPAIVELAVLPAHRRSGHGTALAEAVEAILRDSPATLVQTETYTPEGIAFAESRGLHIGNEEQRMLLDLPAYLEADANRYKQRPRPKPTVGPADPTEFHPRPDWTIVSWIGMCPEELVESWARLRRQMDEDVPLGDLTRSDHHADVAAIRTYEERMAEQGWILVSSMAQVDEPGTESGADDVDPATLAVGYTEIMVSAHDPDIIIQEDTLVDRSHRGLGIGRALKVANMRQLHDVPEAAGARWIQTYTSTDNAAMLALNEDLGFRVVDTMTALEGPVLDYTDQ